MQKYLLALVLSLWVVSFAKAQEEMTVSDYDAQEELETNVFGYPEANLVKAIVYEESLTTIKAEAKPECDDVNLAAQAREALSPYMDIDVYSAADKRKIRLVLKNVDNFSLLDHTTLVPQENRLLAARLVELKINLALYNENIRVCQSDNPILGNKLYLVMYDDPQGIRVDILNFSKKQIPSFIFKQD